MNTVNMVVAISRWAILALTFELIWLCIARLNVLDIAKIKAVRLLWCSAAAVWVFGNLDTWVLEPSAVIPYAVVASIHMIVNEETDLDQ